MASRKKAPSLVSLPHTIWHSEGLSRQPQAHQAVERRLEELSAAETVDAFCHLDHTDETVSHHMFEARWSPAEGVRVHARMTLAAPDDTGFHEWEILAEASAPWNWSWPSPATMFWTKTLDSIWDLVKPKLVRYRLANLVQSPAEARSAVKSALDTETALHVLTFYDVPETGAPMIPLVRYLPPSFTGRIVEHRVPRRGLGWVNRELRPLGLHLKPYGAVILPQRSQRSRISPADLTVGEARPGQGRPEALIQAVLQHAALPRQVSEGMQDSITLLREQFTVPTDQELIEQLDEDRDNLLFERARLRDELNKAAASLDVTRQETQAAHIGREEALRAAEQARQETADVRTALHNLQSAYDELSAKVSSSALGQALREAEIRRDAAEAEVEAAEELLDEQAREIAWLRSRRTATTSRGAVIPAPRSECPASWERLVEQATAEFGHIVLGDVLTTVRPLRGHTMEATWRQRTWEALRVLDAYARAKREHGNELLPHLTAYLKWPDAPVSLPRSRYAPSESQSVLMSVVLREERIFPVPRQVDPSGRVLMLEHIRIGSGKPPAPRMHFYDHTAAEGLIYVGHIGGHLRNSATN